MTARPVPEWIGRKPTSMPSKLVKLRIYAKQNGLCACGCTRVMNLERDKIDCDHIVPLIDGGLNAESNLQLMLAEHHGEKTKAENSQRAEARQHQAKAFTSGSSKLVGRGFPKAKPQRRASTPIEPKFEHDILARRNA
jgi:5-methylcytosine-specific restriction enzyme A